MTEEHQRKELCRAALKNLDGFCLITTDDDEELAKQLANVIRCVPKNLQQAAMYEASKKFTITEFAEAIELAKQKHKRRSCSIM